MTITFCGHSTFNKTDEYELELLKLLELEIGDAHAEFFLGGYGNFDSFAYSCCKKYKSKHPNVSLVFVTPYMNVDPAYAVLFDSLIYPDIENKPLKFAINYRNQYMVEKADIVIAFIDHEWGGAYKTYAYAKRKGKKIINLAEK